MKEELWMKKIKERLDDYSEPLPPTGWERLEKDLSTSKPSSPEIRRIVPFRRWGMSAAAALLVAVSSVSLWLLYSPVADEVRSTPVPVLAVTPEHLPGVSAPATPADVVQPMREAHSHSSSNGSVHSWVAHQREVTSENVEALIGENVTPTEVLPTDVPVTVSQREQVDALPIQEKQEKKQNQVATHRPSSKDKLHLPLESKKSSHSQGWAVGLSVGNTGGLNNMGGSDDLLQSNAPNGVGSGSFDLSSTASGIVSIPNGQELVFKNGLPYLKIKAKQIASIDHKQPLSFGLSVRKNLSKGFSVETGLTYTYLASEVRYEDSYEKLDQKLHYLGIPLRANWNFVDNKKFVMYLSGGGVIEKCVYGKIGSEDETVKPVQLSVMGAVGAQYNVSNHVGLYVEPGVSYFFNDKSSVETIRKENPCNFTLQAGIRLTY